MRAAPSRSGLRGLSGNQGGEDGVASSCVLVYGSCRCCYGVHSAAAGAAR